MQRSGTNTIKSHMQPSKPGEKSTRTPTFTRDTHGKPNKQLFPKHVVIQLPNGKQKQHLITYSLLQITKENKTGTIMDSYYSGDHIARDHIHTDTATCYTQERSVKHVNYLGL